MRYDVAVMVETGRTTAEELLAMGEGRRELIRGEVVELSPGGPRHGRVVYRLGLRFEPFVESGDLGTVYVNDTGFLLERDPDLVRAPDLAFVAKGRPEGHDERRYFPFAPDLAVEVVSPSDTFAWVEEKAATWLSHGTRLVWVIEPELRKAFVYRPDRPRETLSEEDELRGEDVLPGLAIRLADCL
jgi:Uma2 family endonuclease